MAKLEPIIKTWYDNLAEGKLTGKRCKECGCIMFPPVPVCYDCSGTDLEWTEMSGEGVIRNISLSPMGCFPYNVDEELLGIGVELKEGMYFDSWLLDYPEERDEQMNLVFCDEPVAVKAEIVKVSEEDNIYFPYFRRA